MKKSVFSVTLLIMMFVLICVSCGSAPEAASVTPPVSGTTPVTTPVSQPAPVTPPVSGTTPVTTPASQPAPVTPPTSGTAPVSQPAPVTPPALGSAPVAIPIAGPESTVQIERPAQVYPEALTVHVTRTDDTRKRAIDFDSPAYFPSDWETIEAMYDDADNLPKSTDAEIQQAAVSYNAVADAYDELFRKTVPLYAQAREDEVMAARDELISTGFTDYVPEYLQNADKIALAAMDQYDAGDYYGARDTAAKALDEYETLMIGAKVFLTRQEIIDRGFIKYDPENFDKAEEVVTTAMDEYEAGNREAAIAAAEEAQLRYNVVLENGWTAYAADRKKSAVLERELALAERANIATRDIFREGETIFNQAEEIFESENYRDAALLYTDAEAIYVISRQETEDKRRRALEVIRIAEEKIEESNETAVEAERIIEGGPR